MFIDSVHIQVKGGDGGNGAIAFLHEKFMPNGGPAGGDGGNGGSVYFVGNPGINTLQDFRYKKKIYGNNGESGGNKKRHGKAGDDIYIQVPIGTLVYNKGILLVDIQSTTPILIAKGGAGGRGNAHFVSSTNKAPKIAENGEERPLLELDLELKLLCDVGLLGLPSVGKSSLLNIVSAANSKIGAYDFTTLEPVLGLVKFKDVSFVMADLPGLIEGAEEGKGLGTQFLKHLKRCRLLLHVVDASKPINEIKKNIKIINNIVDNYDQQIASLKRILVFNKIDLLTDKNIDKIRDLFIDNNPIFISTYTRQNINILLERVIATLNELPAIKTAKESQEPKHIDYDLDTTEPLFTVTKEGEEYVVSGDRLYHIFQRINTTFDEGVEYLQKVLYDLGVEKALLKAGIKVGDLVRIFTYEFTYE